MNRVDPPTEAGTAPPRFIDRALNWIERVGNTLPDPPRCS
jgi:p-aminobenzoyl-glutamate transporter AbgT